MNKFSLIALLCLILAACGSGGSSSNPIIAKPTTNKTSWTQVSNTFSLQSNANLSGATAYVNGNLYGLDNVLHQICNIPQNASTNTNINCIKLPENIQTTNNSLMTDNLNNLYTLAEDVNQQQSYILTYNISGNQFSTIPITNADTNQQIGINFSTTFSTANNTIYGIVSDEKTNSGDLIVINPLNGSETITKAFFHGALPSTTINVAIDNNYNFYFVGVNGSYVFYKNVVYAPTTDPVNEFGNPIFEIGISSIAVSNKNLFICSGSQQLSNNYNVMFLPLGSSPNSVWNDSLSDNYDESMGVVLSASCRNILFANNNLFATISSDYTSQSNIVTQLFQYAGKINLN